MSRTGRKAPPFDQKGKQPLNLRNRIFPAAAAKSTITVAGGMNMKISARNQFRGIVTEIQKGAVNGIVKIDIGNF